MTDQPAWILLEFLPKLDDWITAERPLPELRVLVTDWIFTRISDPFANARRVPGFTDYWQAVVPGSDHFDDVAEGTVRRDQFRHPVPPDRVTDTSPPYPKLPRFVPRSTFGSARGLLAG